MTTFAILLFMGYIAIGSSVMLAEKKRLYKEGKIDYYGNPIGDDEDDKL